MNTCSFRTTKQHACVPEKSNQTQELDCSCSLIQWCWVFDMLACFKADRWKLGYWGWVRVCSDIYWIRIPVGLLTLPTRGLRQTYSFLKDKKRKVKHMWEEMLNARSPKQRNGFITTIKRCQIWAWFGFKSKCYFTFQGSRLKRVCVCWTWIQV